MSNAKVLESSLWSWLKKGGDSIDLIHLERIENIAGVGTPDVQGWLGCQFWCELKALAKKPVIDCEVSPDQVRWARKRHMVGGYSWFLIQVGSGKDAERFLIPGYRAHFLGKETALDDLREYSVIKPTSKARNYLIMMGI